MTGVFDFFEEAKEPPKPEEEVDPSIPPGQTQESLKTQQTSEDVERLSEEEAKIVYGETPLIDIVRLFACEKEGGIPLIPTPVWDKIVEHPKIYRPTDIQKALAKHIVEEKVRYPRPFPTRDAAKKSFKKLFVWDQTRKKKGEEEGEKEEAKRKGEEEEEKVWVIAKYRPKKVVYETREPYKHWTNERVLGAIHPEVVYRASSGHWHDENRLRCPGGWNKGSLAVWEDEAALARVRWPFWSLTDGPCNMEAWRKGASVAPGIYIASQFSPATAKGVYEWLTAETILDPSCGWGDRLSGFYASQVTKLYCGCDPHRGSFELYKEQCAAYEDWIHRHNTRKGPKVEFREFEIAGYPAFSSRGHKHVFIVNGPFEDIPWEGITDKLSGGFDLMFTCPPRFDLIFTSPPYYEIEHYAKGEPGSDLQTWSRYTDFSSWKEKFFFPLLDRCYSLLREGGYMGINIADTVLRPSNEEPKHFKVADPMVDHLVSHGAAYCGALAMVLRKRPSDNQRMKDLTLTNYAEPIWMFQRGGEGATPPIHAEDDDE